MNRSGKTTATANDPRLDAVIAAARAAGEVARRYFGGVVPSHRTASCMIRFSGSSAPWRGA